MMSPAHVELVLGALPFLRDVEPAFAREFQQVTFWVRIPAGSEVFGEGDRCEALALLMSGVVRVYKIGETGREITLYRFGLGESCILTANAILSQQAFPAIAIVEQDAEAVLIPASVFRAWINRYESWRKFVFDLLSQRLATVMALVDEVAFRRLDARVAGLLLTQGGQARDLVTITHQEIASELGSSREVISRILEDFAAARLIRTGRGWVEILDHAGLRQREAG